MYVDEEKFKFVVRKCLKYLYILWSKTAEYIPSMPLEQSTYPSQILRIFGILGTHFKFSFHFISKWQSYIFIWLHYGKYVIGYSMKLYPWNITFLTLTLVLYVL